MEKIKVEEEVVLKSGTVVLEPGKDMTYGKFIDWLNGDSRFVKPSGKLFNAQDIYGYIQRGNLPHQYGMFKVEEKECEEIGLKIVQITEYKEQPKN